MLDLPRRPLVLWSALGAALIAGTACGVALFGFVYAKGLSYASNDPAVCANCHIMEDHYRAWSRSSHHDVAVCNDCHTPHNFLGKYYTKARNGWNHSVAFTTDRYHRPIQINEFNRNVSEQACRSCHSDIVQAIDWRRDDESPMQCARCHSTVGHLE